MARAAYRVTIRRRGRTKKEHHPALEDALAALERHLAGADVDRGVERAFVREFEPVQQVAVRGEVRGPRGVRGGVDVRGDGSAEAFTGKLTRRLIEQQPGEDAYAALRRALAG
jgi:hypothetical protein